MARILVADDRAINRQFLVALLGYRGHEVLEAVDGAQAMDSIAHAHPDLAILDLRMPSRDGLEVLRWIRERRESADLPVIFYLAAPTADAESIATRYQVAAMLPKPSEPEVILAAVDRALGRNTSLPGVERRAADLELANVRLTALCEMALELTSESDPLRILEEFTRVFRRLLRARHALLLLEAGPEDATLWIDDSEAPEELPALRDGLAGHRSAAVSQASLAVPVGTPARTYGRAYAIAGKREPFSSEELRLAEAFASQAALAYENVLLVKRLEASERALEERVGERTARLERAYELQQTQFAVTRVLLEEPSVEVAIPRIVGTVGSMLGADMALYWSVEPAASLLRMHCSWLRRQPGDPSLEAFVSDSGRRAFRRGEGLLGEVWARAAAEGFSALGSDARWLRHQQIVAAGFRSAFMTPLRSGREIFGVLELFSRAEVPVEGDLLEMLESIGAQAGEYLRRRRESDELARAEERFRAVAEQLFVGAFVAGRDSFLYVNPRLAEIVGLTAGELLHLDPLRIVHEDDRHDLQQAVDRLLAGQDRSVRLTLRGVRSDGLVVELEMQVTRGELHGRPIVIGAVQDVTERNRLAEERARNAAMAALGSLIAGVAHEVRNPLFAISASADTIGQTHGHDPHVAETVDEMREQVERLSTLMRDLLEYGRPMGLELAPGTVAEAVADAVRAVGSLAREGRVTVRCDFAQDAPGVMMSRQHLVQAFVNLIDNAIRHSPPGSVIALSVAPARGETGDSLEVRVHDAGQGFDETSLAEVFTPFFTGRAGGTGLGLAIARSIVASHGGTISARNHPGGGGEVIVILPAARAEGSADG